MAKKKITKKAAKKKTVVRKPQARPQETIDTTPPPETSLPGLSAQRVTRLINDAKEANRVEVALLQKALDGVAALEDRLSALERRLPVKDRRDRSRRW